jgi:hypothetical protein
MLLINIIENILKQKQVERLTLMPLILRATKIPK